MKRRIKGIICKRMGGEWTLSVFYTDGTERLFVQRPGIEGCDFKAFASAVSNLNY